MTTSLDAVRALHSPQQPGADLTYCKHDLRRWPCPTALAVDPEETTMTDTIDPDAPFTPVPPKSIEELQIEECFGPRSSRAFASSHRGYKLHDSTSACEVCGALVGVREKPKHATYHANRGDL